MKNELQLIIYSEECSIDRNKCSPDILTKIIDAHAKVIKAIFDVLPSHYNPKDVNNFLYHSTTTSSGHKTVWHNSSSF